MRGAVRARGPISGLGEIVMPANAHKANPIGRPIASRGDKVMSGAPLAIAPTRGTSLDSPSHIAATPGSAKAANSGQGPSRP